MISQNLYLHESDKISESKFRFVVFCSSDVIDDHPDDVPTFMFFMIITVDGSTIKIESLPPREDMLTKGGKGFKPPHRDIDRLKESDMTRLGLELGTYYRILTLIFQFRFCIFYSMPSTMMTDPSGLYSKIHYVSSSDGCELLCSEALKGSIDLSEFQSI